MMMRVLRGIRLHALWDHRHRLVELRRPIVPLRLLLLKLLDGHRASVVRPGRPLVAAVGVMRDEWRSRSIHVWLRRRVCN